MELFKGKPNMVYQVSFSRGACSADEEKAAQINYDVADKDRFFMPGFSWPLRQSHGLGLGFERV